MAVDPTSYAQGDPRDNPNPNMISKTRQDLSAGLLEASFGILGETFAGESGNPNMAAPYAKLGSVISNTLHDRWHKQEYENFQAQYTTNYQRAATSIQSNLQTQMSALDRGELLQPDGSITKIDTKSEGFLRTKDTIIRQSVTSVHKINDQFLQDAGKYATNPYISKIAENLMQSNAQLISEATGPTPGSEAEAGYAKMEGTRQDTKTSKQLGDYYTRMPAGRGGSGKEDPESMDPMFLVQKHGPEGFMRILSGTTLGRKLSEPYQTTAAGQIKKQLIAEDPDLANDPEALARAMEENEQLVQERAGGIYMKTVMPGLANEMEGIDEFERFFPKPKEETAEPIVTGLMSKEETAGIVNLINNDALSELERIVRIGRAKDIDSAINMVIKGWLPGHLKAIASNNKATSEFKKNAKARLIEFLSDPENWGESAFLRERFGKPKPGVLDRITALASEANETRSEQPERGLFRR